MSRVEVAVICYNYGRFLRQCVESVLTQSHRDCRVRIIDDASTDNTPEKCAELAAEDGRVEVLRHSVNRGHIATYNEAIALAEGEYLLLLSADDYLLPGAIERAADLLDRYPQVGMLHGGWLVEWNGRRQSMLPGAAGVVTGLLEPAAFIADLARQNLVSTATAVVRTVVQKSLGGYLPELPHTADLEMWLRFALRSRVAYIDAEQAVYRRHEGNMSLRYRGLADIAQRKAALAMHLADIRALLPGGAMLGSLIHRRLSSNALYWAALAARRGSFAELLPLLSFSLSEGWRCLRTLPRVSAPPRRVV
jgi:hypothetical protein